MAEPVYVILFCEGRFVRIVERHDQLSALAYSVGVMEGAALYGAGSCGAYVIPLDEADLRADEDPSEVARAMVALAVKQQERRRG